MCGEPIPDGVDVWVHKQRLFTCDTNPKDLNKIFLRLRKIRSLSHRRRLEVPPVGVVRRRRQEAKQVRAGDGGR